MARGAGARDRPFMLQRHVEDRETDGGVSDRWEDVGTVFAQVEYLGDADGFALDQRVARQSLRVKIAYRPGVQTSMRLVHNGVPFEITGITEPERGKTLVLQAYAFDSRG